VTLSETHKEQIKSFRLNDQQRKRWHQGYSWIHAYSRDLNGMANAYERAVAVASYLEAALGMSFQTGIAWNPYKVTTHMDHQPQVDTSTGKAPCNESEEAVVFSSYLYRVYPSNSSLNPDPQQGLPLRGGVAVRLARRYT
jgi:hypothetical protein